MMTHSEFCRSIEEQIRGELPAEYEHAMINLTRQVKHNDRECTGICVRMPGESIAPVIYLESYFDQYESGMSMEGILHEVAEAVEKSREMPVMDMNPKMLGDYSFVRDRLQVRLFDTVKNEKRLEHMVHYCYGDLTAGYSIVLEQSREGTMAIPVTPELFAQWNISKKQLHEDALAADLAREPKLCSLMDMTEAMFTGSNPENYLDSSGKDLDPGMDMMVLTNGATSYGAALIVNPRIQERIAEIVGGDFYVLPSSVHEVLILPAVITDRIPVSALNEMVRTVNETEVSNDDMLSDKVQYYECASRMLVNAEAYEKAHEKTPSGEKNRTF